MVCTVGAGLLSTRVHTKVEHLGPLNYEVCIEGYTRQAHIDHLLSCPNMDTAADTPVLLLNIHHLKEHQKKTTTMYPLRSCNLPKRLIEDCECTHYFTHIVSFIFVITPNSLGIFL